jgi:malate dehydrogenase
MGTSAYYAPASSAVAMAKAYLHDEKRLLACAAYLDGEYGYRICSWASLCIVGGGGVEKVVEIPLTDAERAMLAKSAKSVQSVVDICKRA